MSRELPEEASALDELPAPVREQAAPVRELIVVTVAIGALGCAASPVGSGGEPDGFPTGASHFSNRGAQSWICRLTVDSD